MAVAGSFVHKRALVTGASKGIGFAIARTLAEQGAEVFAASRSTSDQLAELGASTSTTFVSADLSDPGAGDDLLEAVGEIDILVNNVGLAIARPDGFLSVTDEQWLDSFTLNFLSTMRTTRAFLPGMLTREGSNIVNMVSVNAELPDPAVIDYCVAKAGLANFSKSLSKEYGAQVRVNWVNPGPVSTDLWLGRGGIAETFSAAGGGRPEDVAAQAVATSDTKRFSTAQEVADLVAFLAGPSASNITGAGFRIDGGLVSTL